MKLSSDTGRTRGGEGDTHEPLTFTPPVDVHRDIARTIVHVLSRSTAKRERPGEGAGESCGDEPSTPVLYEYTGSVAAYFGSGGICTLMRHHPRKQKAWPTATYLPACLQQTGYTSPEPTDGGNSHFFIVFQAAEESRRHCPSRNAARPAPTKVVTTLPQCKSTHGITMQAAPRYTHQCAGHSE